MTLSSNSIGTGTKNKIKKLSYFELIQINLKRTASKWLKVTKLSTFVLFLIEILSQKCAHSNNWPRRLNSFRLHANFEISQSVQITAWVVFGINSDKRRCKNGSHQISKSVYVSISLEFHKINTRNRSQIDIDSLQTWNWISLWWSLYFFPLKYHWSENIIGRLKDLHNSGSYEAHFTWANFNVSTHWRERNRRKII